MTTPSRIEDLRRRVDRDPASLAFAHRAEEHHRNRDYEAIHQRSPATVPAFHKLDQFVSENALPAGAAAAGAGLIPPEETPSPDARASAALERWPSAIDADRPNRG